MRSGTGFRNRLMDVVVIAVVAAPGKRSASLHPPLPNTANSPFPLQMLRISLSSHNDSNSSREQVDKGGPREIRGRERSKMGEGSCGMSGN